MDAKLYNYRNMDPSGVVNKSLLNLLCIFSQQSTPDPILNQPVINQAINQQPAR